MSPTVEKAGQNMPSQFALLGQLRNRQSVSDPRVMLNTNIPFSAFICGLQGSGKSHTTSCMIGELNPSSRTRRSANLTRKLLLVFPCAWKPEETSLDPGPPIQRVQLQLKLSA